MENCGFSVFYKNGKLFFLNENNQCVELIIESRKGQPGQRGLTGPQGQPGSGGFNPSYANLYKTNIQISPINTNVTFDNFYKTADIIHADGTAEITINNTGIYLFTAKLNDNGADNRIYQLTMDGGALPNTVNGKANITGAFPDQSIQVETIIDCLVIIDQPGRILRVNAPFGCALDTPPVPLSVPIAIKASITLFKIGELGQ